MSLVEQSTQQSTQLRDRGRGQKVKLSTPVAPWDRERIVVWSLVIGFIALSLWGLWRVDLNPASFVEGWPHTQNLIGRMLPPRIASEDGMTILRAIVDTFFMAFAGTAIGVILSIPLAFLSAANVNPNTVLRVLARGVIVFTRAVPTIVFALIFVRVYGIGVLPGIVAIGLHSIGMVGKLLADAIEDIDPGPREGVLSTGASPLQDVVTGVWAQIEPAVVAISLYRLEIDFRSAPILGFVGAGGIGVIMRGHQGNLRYPDLLGVALLFVALVLVMEAASSLIRRAILGSESGSAPTRLSSNAKRVTHGQYDLADTPINQPWTVDRIKLWIAGAATAVLFVLSFVIPDVSYSEMFTDLTNFGPIASRLVPRDMAWLSSAVISGLIETVAIGFAATFLSLIVAIPMGFLAASNTAPGRFVYALTRIWALIMRSAPEIVVAVLLVVALGLGPAAGTLALTFGLIGFAAKLFADNIEEAKAGPAEGIKSVGATHLQSIVTAIRPQVLPALVGNSLYLLDISLRSSTVLGIVGAGGIGFLLSQSARTLRWETMGGIVLAIFVIVYAIELLAGWIRKQIS